jgi:hypothetical protein
MTTPEAALLLEVQRLRHALREQQKAAVDAVLTAYNRLAGKLDTRRLYLDILQGLRALDGDTLEEELLTVLQAHGGCVRFGALPERFHIRTLRPEVNAALAALLRRGVVAVDLVRETIVLSGEGEE